MARADKQASDDSEVPATPKAKTGKAWLPIVIAVVVSTAASAGISMFMAQRMIDASQPHPLGKDGKADQAKHDKPKEPAVYIPLDPAFVINLEDAGGSRFLQTQVQLMARDTKAPDIVKANEPRIRNAMLMLFSQQNAQDLATRDGKEKLQLAVLAEVQKILTEETGKPLVEAVYFTSFVIQ